MSVFEFKLECCMCLTQATIYYNYYNNISGLSQHHRMTWSMLPIFHLGFSTLLGMAPVPFLVSCWLNGNEKWNSLIQRGLTLEFGRWRVRNAGLSVCGIFRLRPRFPKHTAHQHLNEKRALFPLRSPGSKIHLKSELHPESATCSSFILTSVDESKGRAVLFPIRAGAPLKEASRWVNLSRKHTPRQLKTCHILLNTITERRETLHTKQMLGFNLSLLITYFTGWDDEHRRNARQSLTVTQSIWDHPHKHGLLISQHSQLELSSSKLSSCCSVMFPIRAPMLSLSPVSSGYFLLFPPSIAELSETPDRILLLRHEVKVLIPLLTSEKRSQHG